jgi:hypothetical protein
VAPEQRIARKLREDRGDLVEGRGAGQPALLQQGNEGGQVGLVAVLEEVRLPLVPLPPPHDLQGVGLSDAMMQWCNDAMMQWCNDAMMQWCNDAVMQWCNDAMVQWCSDAVMQWCSDAVMQWCNTEAMMKGKSEKEEEEQIWLTFNVSR